MRARKSFFFSRGTETICVALIWPEVKGHVSLSYGTLSPQASKMNE